MDRTAEHLHEREEIDRRPAPKMTVHLVDTKIDHYEQAALCGLMVGRSGCREDVPVDNPRVTVCPACQAARDAQHATVEIAATEVRTERTDVFSQALDATHAYGAPEILTSYRDRDGAEWFTPISAPNVIAVRTRTRRRVTTTYPDGTVAQGWETLSETTEPYPPAAPMYAIYQAGYAILGTGATEDAARTDAAPWAKLGTLSALRLGTERGDIHGVHYIRRCTVRLATAVEADGGQVGYVLTKAGILDLATDEGEAA